VVNSVREGHKSAVSTNRASPPLKEFDFHYRRVGMHKRRYSNYQVLVLIFVVINTKKTDFPILYVKRLIISVQCFSLRK
jgi:hypothetical protein